jgi:hypothetical protein
MRWFKREKNINESMKTNREYLSNLISRLIPKESMSNNSRADATPMLARLKPSRKESRNTTQVENITPTGKAAKGASLLKNFCESERPNAKTKIRKAIHNIQSLVS